MLQDLDARGGGAASAVQQADVKSVPAGERDRRPLVVGGAAAGVLVLAAGGWFGWQYWQSHRAPMGPVPTVQGNRIPDRPRFQEPPAAAKAITPATAPLHADAPSSTAAAQEVVVTEASAAPSTAPATKRVAANPAKAARSADSEEGSTVDMPAMVAARKAARAKAAPSAAPVDGVVLRELTPKQASENSYRRALVALQEGRVSAALADLDKAVELDPRNDAARQTYVSLLLENRRTDDAIRQLRLALGIEPRQPGLAMVLARLQLEKGGPALDTLLKTLPYATANADYQAFLAGVLQRDQRHAEAAQHYRDALAISPSNAIWWMGLGISLQADQHLPEAREAYTRARGNAGLTPELKAFVDKKIEQLSR
ncbi:tetratricopeptide repeat protein [Duganella sp. CY42W]|uniref:Tetratricopeptide repeat protein n=2 Tax=Duganella levis TaxID=2692169 RepID=A0ABW9W7Q5_9BURK|nr:tetratricopeptide repeat protein [Duganella levis]